MNMYTLARHKGSKELIAVAGALSPEEIEYILGLIEDAGFKSTDVEIMENHPLALELIFSRGKISSGFSFDESLELVLKMIQVGMSYHQWLQKMRTKQWRKN